MNDARPLVKNALLTAMLSHIRMQMTPIIRRIKREEGERKESLNETNDYDGVVYI